MQQRIHSLTTLFLFVFFIVSCAKNDVGVVTPGKTPVGVPTDVGAPTGEPVVQETIGAEGGSITSADGRITISIPAGAVTSAQQFSVRPITNKNPLAIGDAFRIEPHGYQFNKPVSIQFSYDDEAIRKTIPEALGIAFQDSNGVWQAQGGVVLNKVQRTIKINTSHFSDWSLFETFYLTASAPVVNTGGSVQLEVSTIEDLVVPLTEGAQVPMGKRVTMAAKYITEWKLAGAGGLQADGPNAVYKAPGTVPSAPNPVAVSVGVDLNTGDTYLLVAHIEIVSDDGEIEVQVAGNGAVKKTASVAVKQGGYYHIGDSDGDVQGSYVLIMVPDALGTHPFRDPESNEGTYFHYLVTGANNYVCQYVNSSDLLVASGGGITVTDLGEEDGFLKGTIDVNPAGYGDELKNTIGIQGKFRVRIAEEQ